MQLSQLKVTPKLIEIKINDADIVEQYGSEISFYMRDHLDIQTYFDFYKHQSEGNLTELTVLVKTILKDVDGNVIIGPDEILPVIIMSRVITAIGNQMTSNVVTKIEDHTKEVTQESLPGITEG